MVKNTKGGSKAKKSKNVVEIDRKLELKDHDDAQEYGKVIKLYGSSRYDIKCQDGKNRMGHARGSLKKKKVFVKLGDVVVVSLREFQDDKCDIIYVYKSKEVTELKHLGEISAEIADDSFSGVVEECNDIDFVIGAKASDWNTKVTNEDNGEDKKELEFDFDKI